jgi:hypothetical protein
VPEKTRRRVYWAATLLFFLPQLYSATQMLSAMPLITNVIIGHGYPPYFVKTLAVAKLAGAAAIFYDRARTLKEWAYAGYTFEVLAALVSELATDGSPIVLLGVLLFLGLLLVSYACWRWIVEQPETHAQRPVVSSGTARSDAQPMAIEMAQLLRNERDASG